MSCELLILEMQDGMMCKNDKATVKMMIDKAIENKPDNIEMVFKWQLYTELKTIVEVIPLKQKIFDYAYNYADECGFKTTASIFDEESYDFLMKYGIPFIKIACHTELYKFRNNMWQYLEKRPGPAMISVQNNDDYDKWELSPYGLLCCIPKYPATLEEYETNFRMSRLGFGISDHTIGLELYNKYKPKTYEKHYYVDGLESWDKKWAIKPEQLKLL